MDAIIEGVKTRRNCGRDKCPAKDWSGPGGIRTPDLLDANEARSQLRYRPVVARQPYMIAARSTGGFFRWGKDNGGLASVRVRPISGRVACACA